MRRSGTNLSNGSREQVDDPLMGNSNDALPVDLNDPMTNSNSTPLGDAPSQQAADLRNVDMKLGFFANISGHL